MRRPAWIDLCGDHARSEGLDPHVVAALGAFGGGEEPCGESSFAELEASVSYAALAPVIVEEVSREVDRPQAEMFARRGAAVAALLEALATERGEARLLRVGFVQRLAEVLVDPRPRALRVRAVVDFYYSQAAVIHHRVRRERTGERADSLEVLIARATDVTVTDGVHHTVIAGEGDRGPLHVNVLRISRGAARFAAIDSRDDVTSGASFPELVERHGAVAAISGGFFLYSEPDIHPPFQRYDPVGLLVHGGEVCELPVFRRASFLHDGVASAVAVVGLAGATLRTAIGPIPVDAVNVPDESPARTVAYTRAYGPRSPEHEGVSLAFAHGELVALSRRGALDVPLAGFVLTLPPGTDASPLHLGMRVRCELPTLSGLTAVKEGMAGGPMLVHGGTVHIDPVAEDFTGTAPPATFSGDETFDQNQLPRMALGLTPGGDVVMAAVDGRNFDRAIGFTLHETAHLMKLLGCDTAMNLDGGSSKRMVVRGRIVDIPSTEVVSGGGTELVRPVHSAILVHA